MNPQEYANKAVTVHELNYHPEVPIDVAGTVAFRFGYPEPRYGVTLFSGPRGMVNDGIDWPANKLRKGIAELIVHVAEDCISVVSDLDGIDSTAQQKIAKAIRKHFEIVLQ